MSPSSQVPHIVVLSSLFPSSVQPMAGLFVRERMFRVAQHSALDRCSTGSLVSVSVFDSTLPSRLSPRRTWHRDSKWHHGFSPRFFSVPGAFKSLDGLLMALWLLAGHVEAKATTSARYHRLPLCLPRRLCRYVAWPLAGRACHHHNARHRSPSRQRPGIATTPDRSPDSREPGFFGCRLLAPNRPVLWH